jgi:DMSO/TMAO reductase YedYZ heme-binding membrane subunit
VTSRARNRRHASTVALVVGANLVLMAGLWWRHGGPSTLDLPGGMATALGQVTGLGGTYFVLLEVLLMSRIGWLERFLGLDLLAAWHRWLGFLSVTLLSAHAVSITIGYAESGRQSVLTQIGDFITHYPDVLMSIVGLGLLLAIAATSIRVARRRLSREAWYTVHLYAYLAIALSFAHQLAVGTDLSKDTWARAWWVGLYVAVFGTIAGWRIGRPIVFNLRHRLRVHSL